MSLARLTLTVAAAGMVSTLAAVPTAAQSAAPAGGAGLITFARHIAPILQRSCQQCHNPEGGAPMSLMTYEEARPWARMIKQRTAMGPRAGVMPPWFVEKNIGIQRYKSDISLSQAEIDTIANWADSGAPLGNVADLPPATTSPMGEDGWLLGKPDLIVKGPDVLVPAVAPDKWGSIGSVADRPRPKTAG